MSFSTLYLYFRFFLNQLTRWCSSCTFGLELTWKRCPQQGALNPLLTKQFQFEYKEQKHACVAPPACTADESNTTLKNCERTNPRGTTVHLRLKNVLKRKRLKNVTLHYEQQPTCARHDFQLLVQEGPVGRMVFPKPQTGFLIFIFWGG